MRHALRNLIAFVFLGGIFWFVFRDVDKLSEPSFQILVAALVCMFAVFWLVVPVLVVKLRIFRRNKKNRLEYDKWKLGGQMPEKSSGRVRGTDRRMLFHERGTLYVEPGTRLDAVSVPGLIGEVAFPRERRKWRRQQRVHFYLTDQGVFFQGKALNLSIGFDCIASYRTTPGGVVFGIAGGVLKEDDGPVSVAFTFQNPLIVRDLFERSRDDAR